MPEVCPFFSVDPSRVAFRDELVSALWNGFPVSDGHLLLITDRHVPNWFAALEAEHRALLAAIARRWGSGRWGIVVRGTKSCNYFPTPEFDSFSVVLTT